MSKYKIGDLVTLSAAGRRIDGNSQVREGFGIVLAILPGADWPVSCQWVGGDTGDMHFKDYELKKFKAVKK